MSRCRPRRINKEKPGRWVAEESWPSPRIQSATCSLGQERLEQPGGRARRGRTHASARRRPSGLRPANGAPMALTPTSPAISARKPAARSSSIREPLNEPLELLGAPVLHLDVAADRPNAFVAATLSEVLPDGSATRLTYGILNLTHRDSHEDLKPLEPGKRYSVRIRMNECGQRIGAGNRLRLAISTAYWPIVWPSPEPVTLTITAGASTLELPVRPPRSEDDGLTAI